MKKTLLFAYLLIILFFTLVIILNREYFDSRYLDILFQNYEKFKDIINANKFLYTILYLFISTLWVCFVGIMTPMMIISTLMFGYLGCIFSIISFTTGSTISYIFAKNFKDLIHKRFNKVIFKNNSFFFFIIFRFIPGIPFMVKNLSGIFFNLNNTKFIIATIIADSPQIILFVYIFEKVIKSSEFLKDGFDIYLLSKELLIPILIIIFFLILIFVMTIKYKKYFYKN